MNLYLWGNCRRVRWLRPLPTGHVIVVSVFITIATLRFLLLIICFSQRHRSFSLSCHSRPFSARSPSRLPVARRSRVKYTLTSNTARRTWVAVRLLLAVPFLSQLIAFDSRVGPFWWCTLYRVNSCAQSSQQMMFRRRSPKPQRTSALWQLASRRMVQSLATVTKAPNSTASSRISCT